MNTLHMATCVDQPFLMVRMDIPLCYSDSSYTIATLFIRSHSVTPHWCVSLSCLLLKMAYPAFGERGPEPGPDRRDRKRSSL